MVVNIKGKKNFVRLPVTYFVVYSYYFVSVTQSSMGPSPVLLEILGSRVEGARLRPPPHLPKGKVLGGATSPNCSHPADKVCEKTKPLPLRSTLDDAAAGRVDGAQAEKALHMFGLRGN